MIAVNVTASRPQHAAASPDRDDEVLASAVLRLAPGVPFEPIARSAASLAAAQLLVPLQNIEILSASGNQFACVQYPPTETCTTNADCTKAKSGLFGTCLDEDLGVNPGSAFYHKCWLPIENGTGKSGCW